MGEKQFDDKQNAKPDLSRKDAVLALDDEQLKQAVHTLAVAGGMDARRADAMSRDPDKIRRKLSSVTERDLEKMMEQISPEQWKALADQLKNL